MARKDARENAPRRSNWKLRITLALGALALLAASIAVRQLGGPAAASAQAPIVRGTQGTPRAQTAPAGSVRPASATAPIGGATNAPMATGATPTINIMSVVNGETITRQELAQECLLRYGEDVLESMLNKQLILNACQQRSIVITQQDVDNEIVSLAGKFGLSPDRWLQLLKEERNIDPDKYRRDIVWPTLALRRLAEDQIQVTSQEIQQALEADLGPKVSVRLISVSKREKAEQIRAMALANPDDFGKLAKEHSEDKNSAATRGMIPPIRHNVGDPAVEQAAFALQEGEISQVIPVANQFLILQCEKQIGPTLVAAEYRRAAEQQIADHLKEKKMRSAAGDLFATLQQQVKVVNVYNNPQLRTQFPGVAATIDDTQITIRQLSEECISRHGKDVLEGEINRKLLVQELARQKQSVTPEDIDREIARAAESYGYVTNGQPDIDKWLEQVTQEDGATVELYVRDAVWPSAALKKLVGHQVEVKPEDLQKGFEANYGERVEVLAIVLGNQRQALEVWKMAKQNPTDKFFGELAAQYSIEPASKANLGHVPPIQKHGGQPKIEEEAFKLQPGEISGLITVADKSIILRCLGRTKPVVESFDDVRDELQRDLYEKKLRLEMAQKFDQLKEDAQVDNFLAGTTQSGKRAAAAPRVPAGRVPFGPSAELRR